MKKIIITLCAILILAAGTAQADIAMTGAIASWDQYGQPGNQVSTPGTGSSHITAIDMTRGAGLGANTGGNSLNSNGWTGEATDYVQFGLTVEQGYNALLDKLYFATKVSSTGPTNLVIKTSADGYTTDFATITQDKSGGTNNPYTNSVIDLSSLGSIVGGSTFYVRFYGTGATSASGTMRVGDYFANSTYYYDSITGTVAADTTPTPIPAAAWLLGSGVLGLAGIRRRQKQA